MDSSPELRAIDRCTESMTSVIKIDPLSVAVKLLSKELLPHSIADRMKVVGITEEVKALEIITAIRSLVAESPHKFHEFLRILTDPWLSSLTENLSSTYSKCIQVNLSSG